MPPSVDLLSLKISQLRQLLTQIGNLTSGTKPVLAARLASSLRQPLIPFGSRVSRLAGAHVNSNSKTGRRRKETAKGKGWGARVLSIDMGIRNLAYCVVDISIPPANSVTDGKSAISKEKAKPRPDKENWAMNVVDWKRVNLFPPASTAEEEEGDEQGDSREAYSPAHLAPAAVSMVHNVFAPLAPDLIAIERQRFRSGGGSAVLEWTLRVNMLEGMLYAAFHSLAGSAACSSSAVSMEETRGPVGVSPARVARYWVPNVSEGKRSVEKKDKIEVVRRWLRDGGTDGLAISFAEEVEDVRAAVLTGKVRKFGKVDDLADCLLQAGALASWERNRREIVEMDEQMVLEYCRRLEDKSNGNDT